MFRSIYRSARGAFTLLYNLPSNTRQLFAELFKQLQLSTYPSAGTILASLVTVIMCSIIMAIIILAMDGTAIFVLKKLLV